MKTHELKILPEYFGPVVSGRKTFEIRENDRDFKELDRVILKEWDGEYTGREVQAVIKFITDYAQKDNYVVFSIKLKGEPVL